MFLEFNHGIFDPKAVHFLLGNAASPSSLYRYSAFFFSLLPSRSARLHSFGMGTPSGEHAAHFQTSPMLCLRLIFIPLLILWNISRSVWLSLLKPFFKPPTGSLSLFLWHLAWTIVFGLCINVHVSLNRIQMWVIFVLVFFKWHYHTWYHTMCRIRI